MRISRPRFAIYGAALLLSLSLAAGRASAGPSAAPLPATAAATSDPAVAVHVADGAADHVITGEEIQSRLDQKVHSDEADRQAIRDLLSRPEVRHIAGSAGLSLERANAAVATLSGPELARLATQAREADSAIVGGKTVTMTWTMVIIVVVALVVLISVL